MNKWQWFVCPCAKNKLPSCLLIAFVNIYSRFDTIKSLLEVKPTEKIILLRSAVTCPRALNALLLSHKGNWLTWGVRDALQRAVSDCQPGRLHICMKVCWWECEREPMGGTHSIHVLCENVLYKTIMFVLCMRWYQKTALRPTQPRGRWIFMRVGFIMKTKGI